MIEEPQPAQPSNDLATWAKENHQRRSEAVAVALRNFVLSRQFLTEGKLSESEKLIRFFEGVTMSLQPEPDERATEEVQAAFRSVLRYHSVLKQDVRDNDGEQQVFFTQAHCNLAVSAHRQYLRSVTPENEEAFETARKHYIAAIRESNPFDFSEAYFPRGDRRDGYSPIVASDLAEKEIRSCARRRLAASLCASVGILNLLLFANRDLAGALYEYTNKDNSIIRVTPSVLLSQAATIAQAARTWEAANSSIATIITRAATPRDQGPNSTDQNPRVNGSKECPRESEAKPPVEPSSVVTPSGLKTAQGKPGAGAGIRRAFSLLLQNLRSSPISTLKEGKASADLREHSISRAIVEELDAIELEFARRLDANFEAAAS